MPAEPFDAEPKLRNRYFWPPIGDDVPDRVEPRRHEEEIVGRTDKGRPRHVRVDNQGRLILSPHSIIGTDPILLSKLDELNSSMKELVEIMGKFK